MGVDEVGRGPLAGPVIAAAVVLPRGGWEHLLPKLNDSKKMSEVDRIQTAASIRQVALAYGLGVVHHDVIDEINILQASLRAMQIAVLRLIQIPYGHKLLVAVDGNKKIPNISYDQQPIVKGDSKCASIAAASVLAKVVRDRLMATYDRRYPGYGFAKHKGYPTPFHRDQLKRLGPSPIHRKTFAGVV